MVVGWFELDASGCFFWTQSTMRPGHGCLVGDVSSRQLLASSAFLDMSHTTAVIPLPHSLSTAWRCRSLAPAVVLAFAATGCTLLPPGGTAVGAAGAARVSSDLHVENGHLVGTVVVHGLPRQVTKLSARATLPGAQETSVPTDCVYGDGVKCWLGEVLAGGAHDGIPLDNAKEGAVTIDLLDGGNKVAGLSVDLVRVPSLGGATVLVADPGSHAHNVERLQNSYVAWIPADKRAQEHALTLVWYEGGARIDVNQRLSVKGPGESGPLVDVVPVSFSVPVGHRSAPRSMNPRDLGSGERSLELFVFSDGKIFVDHYAITTGKDDATFAASPPPADRLQDAKSVLKPMGRDPETEGWACAVSLDARAKPLLDRLHAIRGEETSAGSDRAVYYAHQEAKERARREHREVTDADRATADRKAAPAEAADNAQIAKLEVEKRSVQAKLSALAAQQKSGCLRDALPAALKSLVSL